MPAFIFPDWPAPPWVKAVTTTRQGGLSAYPFDSLNLSHSVGDNLACVLENRARVKKALGLTRNPLWLKQIHGTKVISANYQGDDPTADAVFANVPQSICAVLTADCLPILVCSKTQYGVLAMHAGWRGLLAGVIENSIAVLNCPADDLLVWLGPAIGPKAFFVGEEVFQQFVKKSPAFAICFEEVSNKLWLANIYQLATQQLIKLGITAIYGGQYCTYTQQEQFFSFRRDKVTGRLASLIWIK